MGGYDEASFVDAQQHFKQLLRRHLESRSAVPFQLAPGGQQGRDTLGRLHAGNEDQDVHPPPPTCVDRAAVDLRAQDEPDAAVLEQAVARVAQLRPGLGGPHGLCEVAAGEQVDALDPRPLRQVLERQALAGAMGVGRVSVQVCGVRHGGGYSGIIVESRFLASVSCHGDMANRLYSPESDASSP